MSGKSGTAPNTSIVLTAGEIEFINQHYNGSKSAAIHKALELLMTTIRQNKIDAVMDCLEALKRGVQEPTIVNENGMFEYIPGAYLSDVSYTGSRQVVMDVSEAAFGSDFDVDEASDEELQQAAEWAADEWEWEVEE